MEKLTWREIENILVEQCDKGVIEDKGRRKVVESIKNAITCNAVIEIILEQCGELLEYASNGVIPAK